ncbi:endonuclease-reverse transcriptase [Elysia marginata]|uniref:Endonuclease-reverse transcriptase n=1 Tax=Elysia marginata TaxID=1093978 RepID=A0AAV4I5E2_9GAST|nr:endonuclease-reverse transcriptase [Elysia marginata]
MTKMGFPQQLISIIASLYHNQKATIRWNNANCEPFNIEKGVRQGCILSPHLFNLYTEQIMKQADINDIGGRDITNLRYAEDTALLSDNLTSMKRILHRINNAGQQTGLLLNAKKTKVMHIPASKESNNVEPDIKIDRTSLENVDDFKYLGSIKTSDGTCTKDINTRIAMAKHGMVSLNNIWKDKSIPKPLKFKLLKTLVWPRMLYGCETKTMRKADELKIEAAEMWFFRRLLRVSWKDRRTNGNVLAEMGTERTLLSLVKERRLKYIGHTERITKTDLMKTIFEGKREAKRGRGRPSRTRAREPSDHRCHRPNLSCMCVCSYDALCFSQAEHRGLWIPMPPYWSLFSGATYCSSHSLSLTSLPLHARCKLIELKSLRLRVTTS